jgi:hypothetical protein
MRYERIRFPFESGGALHTCRNDAKPLIPFAARDIYSLENKVFLIANTENRVYTFDYRATGPKFWKRQIYDI